MKKIALVIAMIFCTTIYASNSNAASVDLREASMCNRYFPIYEAKYHMPSNMLRAISVIESGKWSASSARRVAWPWTINVEGKGYQFSTKREAIMAVKKAMSEGKRSIDIGCMQINLKYHPQAFYNLQQAFEPNYNIAYGAKFLYETYKRNGNWASAISNYHNANPELGRGYLAKVYEIWRSEDKAVSVAMLDNKKSSFHISVKRNKNAKQETSNDSDVSDITKSALERFVD